MLHSGGLLTTINEEKTKNEERTTNEEKIMRKNHK